MIAVMDRPCLALLPPVSERSPTGDPTNYAMRENSRRKWRWRRLAAVLAHGRRSWRDAGGNLAGEDAGKRARRPHPGVTE